MRTDSVEVVSRGTHFHSSVVIGPDNTGQMAFSTDVNLPRSHRAVFPDKCVVCGTSEPGATLRLITGTLGWWTWLLQWFGKPFIVTVPACRVCAWKLRVVRLGSWVIVLGMMSFVYWVVWPHLDPAIPQALRRWMIVMLTIVCLLPQMLVGVFFPHAFDVTAHPDSVDYEFADKQLAAEFATSNFHAEWVKVNEFTVMRNDPD